MTHHEYVPRIVWTQLYKISAQIFFQFSSCFYRAFLKFSSYFQRAFLKFSSNFCSVSVKFPLLTWKFGGNWTENLISLRFFSNFPDFAQTFFDLHSNISQISGINKFTAGDGKQLADPEVLRRLTSSVSCALDEAAAALTRMRSDSRQANKRFNCSNFKKFRFCR